MWWCGSMYVIKVILIQKLIIMEIKSKMNYNKSKWVNVC